MRCGGGEKGGILSEIQVWPPSRQSEFIAPLNILQFESVGFTLPLRPYEGDTVTEDAVSHGQNQNSDG